MPEKRLKKSARRNRRNSPHSNSVIQNNQILDHQKLIEQSKDTAEKYSTLFNTTSDGIWISNLKGKILEVNNAYCRMSGYSKKEFTRMTISRLEAIESPNEIAEHMKKIIRQEGHDRFESQHRRKNGTIFDVDITALYFEKDGGKIAVFIRDITERKKREEELFRLNRTLKALSNSSQAIIHANDEASYINEVCQIIVKDCGYSMVWIGFAENDKNKTVHPVASAGFEEGYLKTLRLTWADTKLGQGPTGTAIRTGRPTTCNNMLTDPKFKPWRKEATKRGYTSSLVLPVGSEKKIIGAINIYSSQPNSFSEPEIKLLTELADDFNYGLNSLRLKKEHLRSGEELLQAREYLENLLDYANAPIIVWDSTLRITRFNHAFERLTDYKAEEVLGKKLNFLFPNESANESLVKIGRTLTGEYWEGVEIPILRKDKNIRIVLWNSANIYGEKKGNIAATIAQGQDITERIRLEKQKDEFINIASHELKTPLTSIKVFTQILTNQFFKSKDKNTYHILTRMGEQIDKLTNLVVTMLDVTKIQSGKLTYQSDLFNLDALIKETVNDITLTIGNDYQIKIIGKTNKIIKGDRFRIAQILTNLLINAIKYSPDSKKIIVKTKSNKKGVLVSVKDFGIGIQKDKFPFLFDRFYRIIPEQETKGGFTNLGMGLYISSEIVKRHGGKIWVKSALNKGSTFYFSLPIKI